MFTRTVVGKDIVYKKGDVVFGSVLSGAFLSSIGVDGITDSLRYLAINSTDGKCSKAKDLERLLSKAKARDGVHSLVTLSKYRFQQTSPKTVVLTEI